MNTLQLDLRQTIILAILVLYLGKFLTKRISFLQTFNIPDAVSGGVIASLFFGAYYLLFGSQILFDLGVRDAFLIIFFTTLGLSSRLDVLLKGGKPLLILLGTAVVFLIAQNLTGILAAAALGLKLPFGLLAGSISLSGGHGTTIAWSPIFQADYGIENASEIGLASATFGLVFGGVIGGPLAKFLILKYQLQPDEGDQDLSISIRADQDDVQIDYLTLLNAILVIAVAIGLGFEIHRILVDFGLRLPPFVTCLLAGIALTNTLPLLFRGLKWPGGTASLALIADVCLGLFLAISLMSLQLWTLADMGWAIALILALQLLLSIIYTLVFVFPLMGKNYTAAVVSAGYSGLTLGATPTAIANMTAVTEQFGAAPQAFIIVPLVGAFFIDLANALVIQRFLTALG
ncbi:MAG: sodium/glutamate symporter [Cyanobacteria bacterium RI_101]|nr:sodium/glutamate symporter [Cyanobacteria bacterium RI_101]